jgi:hypothetical protein
MKKLIATVIGISMMFTVPAFAQHSHGQAAGSKAQSQSGATAAVSQQFEASDVPVQMPGGPMLMSPQIQQQIQPTDKDRHFNRSIKPWALKNCWTTKDYDRIANVFGWGTMSEKGTLQLFPFEDMAGSVPAFTVVPVTTHAEAMKVYKLVAAGTIYATDSETTYMQQWFKAMKANFKTVGAKYVMVIDEGAKLGAEANGWNLGLAIGGALANTGGNQMIGATVGAGIANSQTVSQEYPHLTIIFLDDIKAQPVKK